MRPRHQGARGLRHPVDRARSVRNAPSVEVVESLDLPVSCEQTWAFLADVENHSTWNPLVRSARGTFAEHADIDFVDMDGRRRIVRVTSMSAPAEICLYWHHPTPGALAVEHVIELETLTPSTCRITQRQLYRGALVGLLHAARSTGADALRKMNEALRTALAALSPRQTPWR